MAAVVVFCLRCNCSINLKLNLDASYQTNPGEDATDDCKRHTRAVPSAPRCEVRRLDCVVV